MNGEVAQLVSLVAHGSRFLVEGGPAPELYPEHSTFRWVGEVRFDGAGKGTGPWFESLQAGGVERLALFLPAARPELAAFANAARGAIWADGPRREIWTAGWEVRDREAAEQRIWAVTYEATPDAPPVPASPPSDEAAAGLDEALAAADRLAARHAFLASFAGWFAEARAALAADDPVVEYHPDLVPAGWDLAARRLLTAAASAWVFGGMGSWNDVSFPDDDAMSREHEEVTARLYSAVCAALVAGANAQI